MVKFKMYAAIAVLVTIVKVSTSKENPPYDGWYNNRGNPAAGTPDSVLTRRMPAHYADGVYAPSGPGRPNPRTVSTEIMSGSEGLPSLNNKTALFVFFGSQVMQEISDVEYHGCPPEHFNIPVPSGDPVFDSNLNIPYQRSRYNQKDSGFSPNHPRNQLNAVTSYIDGSSIYGTSKAWCDKLRLHAKTCSGRTATSNLFASQGDPRDCRGELASLDDAGYFPVLNSIGLPLFNPATSRDNQLKTAKRFYRVGSRLAHENPFHLSLNIMWFRHHNYLARIIRDQNAAWSDQEVFEEARVQNIATYQNIIMYEWLPTLLGNCSTSFLGASTAVPNYTGYKPGTAVGVSDIFQGAAMHYLSTVTPPGVYRRNSGCTFRQTTSATGSAGQPALRTCNTYWNSKEALSETDIDEILMGMASQIGEREDHVISSDLRNHFYGSIEFSRKDLVSNILQKGRDHGLPDYNSARVELGFARKTTFADISASVGANLSTVSGSQIENVDIFTGGLLESNNGEPGELFCSVIRDQFLRLRDGDRFWFENTKQNHVTNVTAIKDTKIRDVILRTNPSLNESVDIQDYPFLWDVSADTKLFCPQPAQLTESDMEPCTPLQRFDNFASSQASYAVTFAVIGLFTILTILLMYWLGAMTRKSFQRQKQRVAMRRASTHAQRGDKVYIANEILGQNATQQIRVHFGPDSVIITKLASSGKKLRKIELKHNMKIVKSISGERKTMYIRGTDENYDLVLSFADEDDREVFLRKFSNYMGSLSLSLDTESVSESVLMAHANTKHQRDAVLQTFFRTALAQALKIDADDTNYTPDAEASKMLHVVLSKEEFAKYLKLKPESLFVEQMFQVADVNDDGEVSFREFLDIMVLFTKGSARDKAKLLFNMYDLNRSGSLSVDEFKVMLKSMMEMSNTTADTQHIDELVNQMIIKYGTKEELTLDDFQFMMNDYQAELSQASIAGATVSKKDHPIQRGTSGSVNTKLSRAKATASLYGRPMQSRVTVQGPIVHVFKPTKPKTKWEEKWVAIQKLSGYYRNHIFCVSIYFFITLGVFAEAFYAVASNNASGLKGIGGYSMATARASAAALMFNFSSILLTMSRNTITQLRETFLHRYIPFDSAITMHRIVAWLALFFTAIHVLAHGINFYSISTQSASDLLCVFSDMWYPSNFLPTFVFWCYQTITGITGVILTLIVIVMYVFAANYARRLIFNWFQWTHKLGYLSLYFFTILHGSGMLISPPKFSYYFLFFATLYTIDRLYSISRKKAEIPVVKAELLPSEVTHLLFKRPNNFDYKAGQWVNIACLAQSTAEYHPFTLSSAPHEEHLSLHIRAVGPWTTNLRRIYDPDLLRDSPYPKLFLDGPYGEGHQDWYRYDVAVLVGGGIGVTPFASILKDLVERTESGVGVKCKAVYFLWVTRDQRQYEWLTDIIREAEEKDRKMILHTHIFITQLPHKFDLRTTMLYICEKHFQKIAGKSLFTGLRATTHFGRPDFATFFNSLAEEYTGVSNFGVFSCGPPPMTRGVDKACGQLNKYEGATFAHHFENF